MSPFEYDPSKLSLSFSEGKKKNKIPFKFTTFEYITLNLKTKYDTQMSEVVAELKREASGVSKHRSKEEDRMKTLLLADKFQEEVRKRVGEGNESHTAALFPHQIKQLS